MTASLFSQNIFSKAHWKIRNELIVDFQELKEIRAKLYSLGLRSIALGGQTLAKIT
jgi:hypothetical protein